MRLNPSSSAMVCRMALVGLHLTVGEGGLQLDLEGRSAGCHAAQARLAKLRQVRAGEVALLALTERLLGPLLAGQPHPVHQVGRDPDLVLGDLPARLGDVAHDGEGGVEEDRLLLLAGWKARRIPCPDRSDGRSRAQQGTEDVAEQKTEEGPSTLPQIRMVQDLVMLMGAGEQLLVQFAQPIHGADVRHSPASRLPPTRPSAIQSRSRGPACGPQGKAGKGGG